MTLYQPILGKYVAKVRYFVKWSILGSLGVEKWSNEKENLIVNLVSR